MDKLIKAIPEDHMGLINAKARVLGVSSSAYIRELIRKDVGIMDIHVEDIPYATAAKIKRNAAASGLTVKAYLFKVVTEQE